MKLPSLPKSSGVAIHGGNFHHPSRKKRRRRPIHILVGVIVAWACLVNMGLFRLLFLDPLSKWVRGDVPNIQVFVVTTPAHGANMERLYQNNNGWHRAFPDIQIFTFDDVDAYSRLASFIKPLKRNPGERSSSDSNLLIAGFQEIYGMNPNADWYLLTEDDTIVVTENLYRFVRELDSMGYSKQDVMLGRCAGNPERGVGGVFPFVVGGSGILMSKTLLRKLVPLIPLCREKYNHMAYGDARIGGCIFLELNLTLPHTVVCKPAEMGYSFTNGAAVDMVHRERPDHLIVTLHEKDPTNIARYYRSIGKLFRKGHDVTWREFAPFLNQTAVRLSAENKSA